MKAVCACVASDLQQKSLKELLKVWHLLIIFKAGVKTLEVAVNTSSACLQAWPLDLMGI